MKKEPPAEDLTPYELVPEMFPEHNKVLVSPEGWEPGKCGDLYVFCDGLNCISKWKLTWRQRIRVLFHGTIWLTCVTGVTQPPVALMAKRKIFTKKK